MNKKDKVLFFSNFFVLAMIGIELVIQRYFYTDVFFFPKFLIAMFVFLVVVMIWNVFSIERKDIVAQMDDEKYIFLDAFVDSKRNYNKLIWVLFLIALGKEEKAIKCAMKLLKVCKTNKDRGAVYFALALCYKNIDIFMAIEMNKKSIENIPDNYIIWNNMAHYYSEIDDHENNGEAIKKSLMYNPESAVGNNNMASYLFDINELESAIYYAQKAIAIDNSMHEPFCIMAQVYAQMDDEQNAWKYAKLFMSKDKDGLWIKDRVALILRDKNWYEHRFN